MSDVTERARATPWLTWTALLVVAALHVGLVLANATAFFVLPFLAPWYVAVPLCSFIFLLGFGGWPCPLTRLENYLRERLELPQLKDREGRERFIGHYFVSPTRRLVRIFSRGHRL